MTPIVIDASAGVELVCNTVRARQLRALLPPDAVPWVPGIFFMECGAVLRRWDRHGVLTSAEVGVAVDELMPWPLRIAQTRPLLPAAWQLRGNITVPDAMYVALAHHLHGYLLTDDQRLARAPNLPIPVLRCQ